MEDKSSILKVKSLICHSRSPRRIRLSADENGNPVPFTENGFTLIETIMVMVIIAILAVAIVVRNPFDAIKLSSATRKVAGDIRYAQKLAISNQSRAGLVFAAAGYSVYRDMTVAAPYPAAVSPGDPCSTDSSNNFVVDFNDPRCSNYQNVTLAPPATTIAFNALGSPVDAAGGAIGPVTITVTYNGSQTITIAAGTGRVSY